MGRLKEKYLNNREWGEEGAGHGKNTILKDSRTSSVQRKKKFKGTKDNV